MKTTKKIISLLIALIMIFPAWISIPSEAAGNDAMTAINSSLASYKQGSTIEVADDGYIGIPVSISTYFDKNNFTVKSGYNGTPVIVYVVNTNTERIGTAPDTEIIDSMLKRGYVVTVVDYKNSPLAAGQALDWSIQAIRNNVKEKVYFTDSIFPSGTYYDNHVVPAGYDISLNNLYWEMDKHAADGTFDFLVNNWNTDFRGIKGDKSVKWVRPDGTRKTVADAKDGTSPVWYNASGTVDANGEYTKVKYTVAETITDLVNPDGSPIDLNQYMNIIYPVNPEKEVPVFCMNLSSQYLNETVQLADRPHLNGFSFRGYAAVTLDYAFVPMSRSEAYGVYNGSTDTYSNAVTDDSNNYGVHMYDDRRVMTAAMRYIRYLALSQPDTFKLDTDHIGVVGNSKGGAFSFIGEKIVQAPLIENPENYSSTEELETAIDTKINSLTSRRGHDGHHNETRFQNNDTVTYTKDGVTIDGGEKQPWLTYNGEEIISGAQLIYASNGVCTDDVSEGHVPQIVMCHENDAWHYYGVLNEFANICYSHNIPMLQFEVPLGHTVAYGPDKNYNIDTYDATFDFANYWLKDDAVKVLYTDPQDMEAGVGATTPITIKFTGDVSESEITKVTVKNLSGVAVTGTWKSLYGNTTWIFTPDSLNGNTMYTINVPAGIKGANGIEMGEDYTANIYTKYDINNKAEGTVASSDGTYFYLTAPEDLGSANKLMVRFRVTNDAANIAALYAVTNFNSSNPDSSTTGDLIGKVNLKGAGYYEIDATDYLLENLGKQVAFLLKADKSVGVTNIYTSDFSDGVSALTVGEMTEISKDSAPDNTPAAKIIRTNSGDKFNQHVIYDNSSITAFTLKDILGFKISEADYGRKFTFKVKVYDTASRQIKLSLNANTSSSYKTVDYTNSVYNYTTKEGEWTTYSFDYAVYDTDFGKVGFKNKNLFMQARGTGNIVKPLYVGEITVDETVTDIVVDNFSCALINDGGVPFKESESDKAFALFNEAGTKLSEYGTWSDALSAYKYGYTLKLMKNYTLTDEDLWSNFGILEGANGENGHIFNIDLNGYTINSKNTKNSLFWLKNTSTTYEKTVVNVSNGGINLKVTPLVSYESSTSSGKGKSFELNFNSVKFGVLDNAYMDSIMSATAIASASTLDVDFNFNNCDMNFTKDKLTPAFKTIFPAGGEGLDILYIVTGGKLNLSSQRWVKIQDQRETVVYNKGDDDKYMTLLMSASALPNNQAFMLDTGVASSYVLSEVSDNVSTYELVAGELSTRYGVIPEEYASVDDYPFVWFDEAGNFKGAGAELYGDGSHSVAADAKTYLKANKYNTTTKSYGTNPYKAYIVLRKDYTLSSTEAFGNSAQVQGTLTIDLNGHTLTQNKKPLLTATAKRWGDSGDAAVFPTEFLWENGTIVMNDNSLVHYIAWDANGSGDVKDKDFINTYKNITFCLKDGATSRNLFTLEHYNKTPEAECNAIINIIDCKFDFETVKPTTTLTLFSGTSTYIKFKYTIEGSEIYADSMANITLMSIVNGSEVLAKPNSANELLTVYVKEVNKASFSGCSVSIDGGIAEFFEKDAQNGYAVFKLEKTADAEEGDSSGEPVVNKVTTTKYVNTGTDTDRLYEIQVLDVTDVVSDGNIASNDSIIGYHSSSSVSKYEGLNATDNASQNWLIELDKAYNLGDIKLVYGYTNKWVDFNVMVSEDGSKWEDLGTIRPEVAVNNGDPVTIPLSGARGRFIKLTVIKRNGTSAASTEATVWGANLGAGCSIALYEVLSVTMVQEQLTPVVSKVVATRYVNSGTTENPDYRINTLDVTESVLDGEAVTNDSTLSYYSASSVTKYSLDKNENASQNWLIELNNAFNLDNVEIAYSYANKWVDFNVKVSGDGSSWKDLGTIRPEVAETNNGSVKIPLSGEKAKFIKLTVIKRNGTNAASTEATAWGANLGAGCSIVLYEVLSVTEIKIPTVSRVIATKYVNLGTAENPDYKIQTVDVTEDALDGALTSNDSTLSYYSSSSVTKYSLDKTENASQNWLIELNDSFEIDNLQISYGYSNKWVDFNVMVSEDGSKWENLGTIRPELAEKNGDPVTLSLKGAKAKYIKITVIKRNGTNAASTEATAWGANLGAGCSIALYEILSVSEFEGEKPLDFSTALSGYDYIFSTRDTITLNDGTKYTGYMGVVFAKAEESIGEYTRTEYGVAISENELDTKGFEEGNSVIFAKGEKINASSQYGIRFYGSGIKEGKTYYTLPYAKYENKAGETISVFGNKVMTFKPVSDIIISESFENGGEGWTYSHNANNGTFLEVVDTEAYDGNKSLYAKNDPDVRVNTEKNYTPYAYSPMVDAMAGTGYEVSAYVKNEIGNQVKVYCKFYSSEKKELSSATIGLSGTDWNMDCDVFIAPQGAVYLRVLVATPTTANTSAFVDNIVVRRLTSEETEKNIQKTIDAPQVIEGIPTEDDSKFHIYLCIGQSNMVGYDGIKNEDILVVDGAYLYNADGAWEVAQPYPATTTNQGEYMAGFNRYSTASPGVHASTGKMGPTIGFARGMTSKLPEDIKIGIISNALGGSTIKQWAEGYSGSSDYNLYEKAVERTKAALEKGGELKGILWLQGEYCASDEPDYMERLTEIADGLRDAFGVSSDEVPFIVSEVPRVKPQSVAVLQTAPQYIDNCEVVSSEGLRVFDGIHFWYDAQRVLGLRFAQTVLSGVYGIEASANDMYEEIYGKKPVLEQ
ncbi:MAG: hypothetical protein E7411_02145 [Ruminococcaceae bacterium]|nr:hypothetical protein [Oscillospiraceae bacterium]